MKRRRGRTRDETIEDRAIRIEMDFIRLTVDTLWLHEMVRQNRPVTKQVAENAAKQGKPIYPSEEA